MTRILNLRSAMQNRGFSLLELLVTLVVLSIGLLGLALMQTTGLGLTKSAYSRTQAMLLANDIADRIRANENSAASYVGLATPGTPTSACITGGVCDGPTLAAADKADWANRIQTELAGGTGTILDNTSTAAACQGYPPTAVASGFMRVLITWNEANTAIAIQNRTGGSISGDCFQFDFVF